MGPVLSSPAPPLFGDRFGASDKELRQLLVDSIGGGGSAWPRRCSSSSRPAWGPGLLGHKVPADEA